MWEKFNKNKFLRFFSVYTEGNKEWSSITRVWELLYIEEVMVDEKR